MKSQIDPISKDQVDYELANYQPDMQSVGDRIHATRERIKYELENELNMVKSQTHCNRSNCYLHQPTCLRTVI